MICIKRLICYFIILCAIPFSVSSHPGRTDSNGGHWDRSDGTYHFHTGEYAGRSSSGSTSNSESKPFTPPYEPPTENPYKEIKPEQETKPAESTETASKEEKDFSGLLSISLGLLPFAIALLYSVFLFLKKLFEEYIYSNLPKQKLVKFENATYNAVSDCLKLIELQKILTDCLNKAEPPEGITIGEDNLPKIKDAEDWGVTFTGYTSRNGRKIHFSQGCGNSYKKTHLYYYNNARCQNCYRYVPAIDFSWYDAYLESIELSHRIKILENHTTTSVNKANVFYRKCNSHFFRFLLSKLQKENLITINNQYYLLADIFSFNDQPSGE